jgi:chaperone LolA
MIIKKIILIVFFIASCTLYAQSSLPQAASVLEKTAQKYNELSAFSLDFKFTMTAMEINIHNFNGKLWVKKDKYYLMFDDQIMANDGKTCWNYQKTTNEATLFDAEDDEFMIFHPVQIINNWSNEYSAKVTNEEVFKQKMVVLVDLTPKKTASFNRLRLFIDKETSYIKQIIIHENEGITMTYTITKFTPNMPVSDAKFTFKKNDYPNVQVSDMR